MNIRHNREAFRFEAGDERAPAVCEYRIQGRVRVLDHTWVPEALRGSGVAGELARAALEHALTEGWPVEARCSYIARYIERHPHYQTLVVRAQVEARELSFAASMANRDLEAFEAHLAEGAIFLGEQGTLRGREAILAHWKSYFETPEPPFEWEPDQSEVHESLSIAYTSGPVRSPAGSQLGRFNTVWHLEGGEWKVVFDKGSPE